MYEITIIALFFIYSFKLIKRLGSGFPLFELTIVLYTLQLGIAPIFRFNYHNGNDYTLISVDKDYYLQFISWILIAFILGIYSVKQKINFNNIKISSKNASKTGRILLLVGLISSIAKTFSPISLNAVFNFFSLFLEIGLFSLIFSNKKRDKIISLIFFIQISITSILDAVLIEFIIFSVFYAMFFTLRYKISSNKKIIILIFSFLFLTVYQGVKSEYRSITWGKELNNQSKLALLTNLISYDSFISSFNADIKNNESFQITMHRLNQGWHMSKVLSHVPKNVDFQYGSDLVIDIFSAIMPRFLFPNKRVVSDQSRFKYYTGYELRGSTAMTIGVIGDFYINFGFYGTIISIFLFGYLFAKIFITFFNRFVTDSPINIIWIPFIFSYLLRPGNEFYMVINHLIKSIIILYFFNKFYLKRLLNNV